jgi:cytochrome c-type biogenesis protein
MTDLLATGASALWLGILTSISPCPLASNVAAISFVGRDVGSPRRVLLAGLVYSLGRALAYVVVGALVVTSLLSLPGVSFFLQQRMNQVLGPLLVVIGVVLLGWLPLRWRGAGWDETVQRRAAGAGVLGPGLLGILFALSFCPVSAGLFFGGLIPLATGANSRVLLPAIYGVGTGLPVVLFAVLLAVGAHWVGRTFHLLTRLERFARPATGVVFILAGGYLIATHLLGLDL